MSWMSACEELIDSLDAVEVSTLSTMTKWERLDALRIGTLVLLNDSRIPIPIKHYQCRILVG